MYIWYILENLMAQPFHTTIQDQEKGFKMSNFYFDISIMIFKLSYVDTSAISCEIKVVQKLKYDSINKLTSLCRVDKFQIHFRQCTEVRFASFLSGGFTTMAVINPLERKLAKRTSVQCVSYRPVVPGCAGCASTPRFWQIS